MSQVPDEARLAEILAELYDAEPADGRRALEEAMAAHPELAEDLRGHAEILDLISEAFELPEAGAQGMPSGMEGFRILEVLGRGGMATVYRAAQDEPVQREVAIKVLHQRLHGPQALARFDVERESLARMDHPHIARVFDAGFTRDSMPYVVMELVNGEPITDYCERMKLALEDRLRMLTDVCEAVQHAHQKGVIHRDLKPTNVLVSDADGKPHVKVIDFGLAKALDDSFSGDGTLTIEGQVLGTPAYMSPEQATGDDVDARTDVYGLGMLLYELLVGEVAWDRDSITQENFAQFVRRLAEEDPPRPSARLSTLHGHGGGTPALPSWERRLRGELDWITMKALAKERARRYATPRDLAEDVCRFLRHEPVQAGPPSTRYRVRKFVRRHRAGVISVCTALAVIVVGLAVSIHHEREARAAQQREEAARLETEELFDFLLIDIQSGLFDTARLDLLESIAMRALTHAEESPFSGQDPARSNRGEALIAVGHVLAEAGRLEASERSYRRAFEIFSRLRQRAPDQPEYTIRRSIARTGLGWSAMNAGRVDEAEREWGEARNELHQFLTHPRHSDIRPLLLEAEMSWILAVAYKDEPARGIALISSLLDEAAGDDSVDAVTVAELRLNLGDLLRSIGRRTKALAAYADARRAAREALSSNPRSYRARMTLGRALVNGSWKRGNDVDFEQADKGIGVLTALMADFPRRTLARVMLATAHEGVANEKAQRQDIEGAEPHLHQASLLISRLCAEAPRHILYQDTRTRVHATALRVAQVRGMRDPENTTLWREALEHAKAARASNARAREIGPGSIDTDSRMADILIREAQIHRRLGDVPSMELAAREGLDLLTRCERISGSHPALDVNIASALGTLAIAYFLQGREAEGADVCRAVLARVPEEPNPQWRYMALRAHGGLYGNAMGGLRFEEALLHTQGMLEHLDALHEQGVTTVLEKDVASTRASTRASLHRLRLMSGTVEARNDGERSLLALGILARGRYGEALALYEALLAPDRDPSTLEGNALYNAACAAARVSESAENERASELRQKALDWLSAYFVRYRAALPMGLPRVPQSQRLVIRTQYEQRVEHARRKDEDLASLRGLPAFEKIFEHEAKQETEEAQATEAK